MWIDSQVFKNADKNIYTKIFVPQNSQIVLGRSNVAETEVYLEKAKSCAVPVTKRRGGGGTVLLYPGCVVISVGAWMKQRFCNDKYFKSINAAVMNSTKSFLEQNSLDQEFIQMQQKGISDLAIEKKKADGSLEFKKFCGTSLFRSRNYLLYQASILFNPTDQIEALLRMPSKEPDYRRGRNHGSFLTTLSEYCSKPITDYELHLKQQLHEILKRSLTNELIEPPQEQCRRILSFIDEQN